MQFQSVAALLCSGPMLHGRLVVCPCFVSTQLNKMPLVRKLVLHQPQEAAQDGIPE